MPDDAQAMRSADRLLQVLASFGHDHAKQSIAEVARRLDLPVSTTRRLLLTLERHGFVAAADGTFQPGLQILRLAGVLLKDSDLVRATSAALAEAHAATDETVLLHVLDAAEVVTVAAVAPDRGVKVFEPIGTRFAAVSGSSSGKVLLAWLPDERLAEVLPRASWRTVSDERSYTRQTYRALLARVREDGYADNDGETDPDLWSISVPVRDHTDGVVAALTFPTLRTRGPQRRAELTAVALKYAAEASTALHFA